MSRIITRNQLDSLLAGRLKDGALVAAPVATANGLRFVQYLSDPSTMILDGKTKPANTIKEFFFPRHEVLYSFVRKENDVEVTDAPVFDKQQIIVGARPCEAASLPILDPLFAWDYQDRFYQSRREKTTIISLACSEADRHCFCSAVGGAPDNPNGSDAMLYELGNGSFEVRVLTDKGKALFDGQTEESDQTGLVCELQTKQYDLDSIAKWLKGHFSDPFWESISDRCVSCGVCTYTCPTCHCFDIVDEGSYQKGQRVKNWDSCQSSLFTLHASGHNPRAGRPQRQRQRIEHKFSIYPEKFGLVLCTGCGNCTRQCGTSLGVRPILDAIEKKQAEEK